MLVTKYWVECLDFILGDTMGGTVGLHLSISLNSHAVIKKISYFYWLNRYVFKFYSSTVTNYLSLELIFFNLNRT